MLRDYENKRYIAIETTEEHIPSLVASGYTLILNHTLPNIYLFSHSNILQKRDERMIWHEDQVPYQHLYKRSVISDVRSRLNITDPAFSMQWHLINTETIGFDLNVTGVWMMGITGKNVTVGFMDDGIDHENIDLKQNFNLEGSYDFNEHKKLPTPALWDDTHGTRCAGEVAAVRNEMCGVGVAYDAQVAGIRILSGVLTNIDEASAVNYAMNTTQIYSCSWGPRDDGRTMEAPPILVQKAFKNGIENGRQGLGSIFVFAAGNGGGSRDNWYSFLTSNFDGYTNSIYTITVAAMDNFQHHPPYSEQCSAVLISTYSSAGGGMQGIYTTDWKTGCTDRHGGTSAAAPLAAGVYALLLSIRYFELSRPDLNWRDVQRLTVENAITVNPSDEGWALNGAGRRFNHKYGYGTFDSFKLIEAAKVFKNVGEHVAISLPSENLNKTIPYKGIGVNDTFTITEAMVQQYGFYRLEHVTVGVNITHDRRGDVEIHLVSPFGTTSRLIETRMYDEANTGFPNWYMSSNAHWDEQVIGNWTLIVFDVDYEQKVGLFHNWTLNLFGEKSIADIPSVSVPSVPTATAPTESIPTASIPISTTQSTATPTKKPITTPGTINYISNTPVAFAFIFIILGLVIVSFAAYKLGCCRRRKHEFVQVNDEEEYDQLALQDLERGETDRLVSSR